MKTIICAIALFACVFTCTAQTDSTKTLTDSTKTATASNKKKRTYIVSNSDTTYIKPEVQSMFPDGLEGWKSFLNRNLRYPSRAIRLGIEGTVVLQFIVCTDGTVCDIEAVSGPEDLRESAVAALKNTPNWIPAVQNGKNVRSYKKQPIIYKLPK